MKLPIPSRAGIRRLVSLIQPALAVLRWEGVILLAALGFGLVSALATRWFYAFVIMSALLLYAAWMRALGTGEASARFRRRAQILGLWVWGILLALIGLAVFWRFSRWWTATIFLAAYLAVGGWHLRWLARRAGEPALLFRQIVALSVLPILLAWFLNSSIYQLYSRSGFGAPTDAGDPTDLTARRQAREVLLAASDGSLAVTLSGGGYRAAAVHAGMLFVLEEAGLPVRYLSTVSGGSIVGGAYGMGYAAAEFRDRLKAARPGLPNDLTNFYPVFAQLLLPGYGSGDTYANHFDRVFFDGTSLGETGPPTLIVNTTRYRDGRRRAFWAETDGDRRLARLVAASGAFPVAFDPVVIDGESYIDGGVVENLGIAGLQNYLESRAGDTMPADLIPDVLVLSDAGLIPEAPPSWNKPSVVQMALRAQQTSYFAMHQWIYSFYTDGEYDRAAGDTLVQPFEVRAGRLWPGLPEALQGRSVSVFVLSPSSPAERSRFAGNEALLDSVSALETLRELAPDEVDAAFWVGAKLALAYLPDICTAAGVACAPVAIGEPPPNI